MKKIITITTLATLLFGCITIKPEIKSCNCKCSKSFEVVKSLAIDSGIFLGSTEPFCCDYQPSVYYFDSIISTTFHFSNPNIVLTPYYNIDPPTTRDLIENKKADMVADSIVINRKIKL